MDIILRRKEINGVEYFVELTRIESYMYHNKNKYRYITHDRFKPDVIGWTARGGHSCYEEGDLTRVLNYHKGAQYKRIDKAHSDKRKNHRAHAPHLYIIAGNNIIFHSDNLERKLWEYTDKELRDIVFDVKIGELEETDKLFVRFEDDAPEFLREAKIEDNKLYVYNLKTRAYEFYKDLNVEAVA